MDTSLLIKLVNSLGLIFDIFGAWVLYKYAFQKPPILITSVSLPATSKTEFINGIKHTASTSHVKFDQKSWAINKYNEYLEFMFEKRSVLGIICLLVGFTLQIISNFTHYLDLAVLLIIVTIFVFSIAGVTIYALWYLPDIPKMPENYGQGSKLVPHENNGHSFTIREVDREWLGVLLDRCKRAGIISNA